MTERKFFEVQNNPSIGTPRTVISSSTPGIIYSGNNSGVAIDLKVELPVSFTQSKTVLATGWITKTYSSSGFGQFIQEAFTHYTVNTALTVANQITKTFTVDGAASFGDSLVGFQAAPLVYSYRLSPGTYTFTFECPNESQSQTVIHGCVILFPA